MDRFLRIPLRAIHAPVEDTAGETVGKTVPVVGFGQIGKSVGIITEQIQGNDQTAGNQSRKSDPDERASKHHLLTLDLEKKHDDPGDRRENDERDQDDLPDFEIDRDDPQPRADDREIDRLEGRRADDDEHGVRDRHREPEKTEKTVYKDLFRKKRRDRERQENDRPTRKEEVRAVKSERNGGQERPSADDLHNEVQNQRDQGGFEDRMLVQKGKEAALFTRFPGVRPFLRPFLIQGEHFLSFSCLR